MFIKEAQRDLSKHDNCITRRDGNGSTECRTLSFHSYYTQLTFQKWMHQHHNNSQGSNLALFVSKKRKCGTKAEAPEKSNYSLKCYQICDWTEIWWFKNTDITLFYPSVQKSWPRSPSCSVQLNPTTCLLCSGSSVEKRQRVVQLEPA